MQPEVARDAASHTLVSAADVLQNDLSMHELNLLSKTAHGRLLLKRIWKSWAHVSPALREPYFARLCAQSDALKPTRSKASRNVYNDIIRRQRKARLQQYEEQRIADHALWCAKTPCGPPRQSFRAMRAAWRASQCAPATECTPLDRVRNGASDVSNDKINETPFVPAGTVHSGDSSEDDDVEDL